MDTITDLKIAELSSKLDSLVQKTYDLLSETDNKDLQCRLSEEMEQLKNRTEFKIAFVGQYSSGKSTIISALTGNKEIKIDANVATDVVSEYKWNNIVLMDTPGILAGKVEQHDERTKKALTECDLIVYVLTSQLFDDVIFENFIDLAYEQRLSDKMMIVINKMSMEDGDFETLALNYRQSINQVFKERGREFDFPTVFIDAADFIDGKEENDDDFIQLSNFNHFVGMLNDFVEKKGFIKQRFDTPVRLLKGYVSDIAIAGADPHLQALSDQYSQKFRKSLRDVERRSSFLLSSFEINTRDMAYSVMNLIGEADELLMKNEVAKLESEMDNSVCMLIREIETFADSEYNELAEELKEFGKKESFILYQKQMQEKIDSPNISIQERNILQERKELFLRLFPNAPKWGTQLAEMASNNIEGAKGLAKASGSKIHELVKSAGNKIGHKFLPWDAVKITAKIGKFAKYGIPVITAFVSIGIEIYTTKQEEKKRKEIRIAKQKFAASIDSTIKGIRTQVENEIKNTILDNFHNALERIDHIKMEMANTMKRNDAVKTKLDMLDAEYVDFIEIIES